MRPGASSRAPVGTRTYRTSDSPSHTPVQSLLTDRTYGFYDPNRSTPSGAITAMTGWRHYGGDEVAPLRRSRTGANTAVTHTRRSTGYDGVLDMAPHVQHGVTFTTGDTRESRMYNTQNQHMEIMATTSSLANAGSGWRGGHLGMGTHPPTPQGATMRPIQQLRQAGLSSHERAA